LLTFGTSPSDQTAAGYTSTFGAAYNINAIAFNGVAGGNTPIIPSRGTAGGTIPFNPSTATTPPQPRITTDRPSAGPLQEGAATTGVTLVGAGTRLRLVGSGLGQLNLSANVAESGGSAGIDIDRGPAGTFGTATGFTVLSGNNTFTGGVRLLSGQLVVGSATA